MPRKNNTISDRNLKAKFVRQAHSLGASLVGFAPVERWAEFGEVAEPYRPQAIWKQARTVIVLGVPMLLPIIESTPSINYQEMYDTTNRLLDLLGFRLSVYLNDRGHASIFIPRDGYGNLGILLKKMPASFSHVYAAKYAGLGTIGYSHNLINPKYGPRARYVSVFTTARLAGDPVIRRELCNKCEVCRKLCPAQAFTTRPDSLIAEMDAVACTRHHQVLKKESRWPCGICCKVCPIGADRKLYESTNIGLYLKERQALERDPNSPDYKAWVHLRSHGSDGKRIF
jgi:epoxyqueuosine reductase QueG